MGEQSSCAVGFDPPIPASQKINRPCSGSTNRFLDTDKSSLLRFWDEAFIRGDFSAYSELHVILDTAAFQQIHE